MTPPFLLLFPPLRSEAACVHGFVARVPGVEPDLDKQAALRRLEPAHREARRALGLGARRFVTAEQVHGSEVAVVPSRGDLDACLPGADALVTGADDVCLGVYVADCCPVFLVDPVGKRVGLVHSGKKGTGLNITGRAVETMVSALGSRPSDMVALLGPCIRPPHYEIDFAAQILEQCRAAGVGGVHDCGENTGADLRKFYSYRMEKGRTGRMLALLAVAGR
jgi:copper oxidase (laccase) domain-containing protein